MRRVAVAAALLLASCKASSGPPDISVDDAWARATVPMQSSSAAYFTIRNAGPGADALLAVRSPQADASLHSTTMDNGVMRMRPLERLDVPANSRVTLKPGGMHVMLMGLKQPLSAGSTVELDLKFQKSGERKLTLPVRPATATGEEM
jgi:copper(I)-binding protein